MESRWVLLGFGLLLAILAINQMQLGNIVSALIAVISQSSVLADFGGTRHVNPLSKPDFLDPDR